MKKYSNEDLKTGAIVSLNDEETILLEVLEINFDGTFECIDDDENIITIHDSQIRKFNNNPEKHLFKF